MLGCQPATKQAVGLYVRLSTNHKTSSEIVCQAVNQPQNKQWDCMSGCQPTTKQAVGLYVRLSTSHKTSRMVVC